MNQSAKRTMLAAAVAFAMTVSAAAPVKAEINFNVGAGAVLMQPVDKANLKNAASQTTESKAPAKQVADGSATLQAEEAEPAAAAVEGATETAAQQSTQPIQTDGAAEVTTIDASAVSNEQVTVSGDSSSKPSDAAAEEAKEQVVLAVGAGNVIPDASLLSEEDMADEFAEEEAAGGAFGYTHLGVVQVDDHLNVRALPEEGSKIVGKMGNEAGCEILDVKGNMAHITSGSVEGYVSLDYLITGPEAVEYASTVVKELATVNADGLKLREDKSLDAPVYNMVAYGEQLEVFEKSDDWVGVKYDGKQLYVAAEYVSVGTQLKTALNMTEFLYGEGVSDVRMELCEYAKQFVGNPYVWGGTSLTKGADCSGFVLSVYAKYGISLPHSSRAQANCGTRISMSEAKPGDLVFYAKGSRINHVGIYIGGGQIVNASSPKTGIRIANAYYRKPVAVVRILQD